MLYPGIESAQRGVVVLSKRKWAARQSPLPRSKMTHHVGLPTSIDRIAKDLFDHLVGGGEQRRWDSEAKRFGRL